jgi:4-amino-4-deoxy-L-arabinose transferase-like glycosyltransferase
MDPRIRLFILLALLLLTLLLPVKLLIPLFVLLIILSVRKPPHLHIGLIWILLTLPILLGYPKIALQTGLRSISSLLLVNLFLRSLDDKDVFMILRILPKEIKITTLLILRFYGLFLKNLRTWRFAKSLSSQRFTLRTHSKVIANLVGRAERDGSLVSFASKLRDHDQS